MQFKPSNHIQAAMIYKPSEAAKACNTSVNTIRNWCRDFASFLSPGASGEGGNRRLTDRDLNTLKYIAQLRSENMQQAAIVQKLQSVSIGDVETAVTTSTPAMPSTALTDTLQPPPAFFVMVDNRLSALEASRASDRATIERLNYRIITAYALGAIGAGLLFAIILLAAWVLGK